MNLLIIEDEFIVAKDFQLFLSQQENYKVDIAVSYEEALEKFQNNTYHLAICDINLNADKTGIDLMNEIGKTVTIPKIYLTAYSEQETVDKAKETNPHAYLLKPVNLEQLKIAVELVLDSFYSPKNSEDSDVLTKREKEILIALAVGKTSKEIADQLNISAFTVDTHKKNIKAKLQLNTIGELVNFAFTSKILTTAS